MPVFPWREGFRLKLQGVLKAAGGLPLWMVRVLSEAGLYKTSFSKYGSAYLDIMAHERKGERKYA